MKTSVSRRMPSAAPQDVWDVISDPHRHVRTLPSSVSQVEVLGSGEIDVALQVSAHAFSASAKEKIAAAGGSTNEI